MSSSNAAGSRATLNRTQHPSLGTATVGGSNQQPAVAVKLFQFDGGAGARSQSAGTTGRPTVVNEHDTAFTAVARPATTHDALRRNPNHHPAGNKPGSGVLTNALRPLSVAASAADQQQQPQQQQQGATSSSKLAGITGQQMLPVTANPATASVVMGQQQQQQQSHGRVGSAGSIPGQQQQQQQRPTSPPGTAKSRATSTDLLFSRYRSRGQNPYGPQVTQMNILHTRHKIQFEFGRLRRLQSDELEAMLGTLKRGIKSAGRIWEHEDALSMAPGDGAPARAGSTTMMTMQRSLSAAQPGGAAAPAAAPPPRSASAARVAALAAQRSAEIDAVTSDEEATKQQRDAEFVAEFGEDQAAANEDDDDDIEKAFQKQPKQQPQQQNDQQPPRSASAAGRRPASGVPHPARVPTAGTTTTATTSRSASSAGGRAASASGQRRPPTAASASHAGRSPAGYSAVDDPSTFRGATASLERSYLSNLHSFLSPSVTRQKRNPSPSSIRREEQRRQKQLQQQQQQQRSRSNSPVSNESDGGGGSNSRSRGGVNNNNSNTPSAVNILQRKTALGARNRSPLTASILKGFAADAVQETRTPSAAKSRPASADHLLSGTRWHQDVEHGALPAPTAVDPADLPRPADQARIEQLPEELRFYAVDPSSPKRYNSEPAPSYFFEEPGRVVPYDKEATGGYSPEAVQQNPVFNQLAMPSKYRAGSAAASTASARRAAALAAGAAQKQAAARNALVTVASPAAPSGAASLSSPSQIMSPGTAQVLAARKADSEMGKSIAALHKTQGIVEYLHERKQQCFCQYSSVIKRKTLELRRRQQQQPHAVAAAAAANG